MELKEFQLNAVKSLFEAMDKPVRDIILKSPTGSGKTIILTYFMHQYIQSYPKTVFVWLTPGKGNLEEQSKAKMDKYIHASQTKLLSDVMTAGFEENDSCFINWEKLTKKGNNALKDSERTNFLEHIEHALNDGLRFIIIVDESHQNNTIKADEIIQYFRTEKIIRCSATPKGIAKAEVIEIPEEEVIAAGLIKKMLVINQDFPQTVETEDQTAYLLERALQKQRELRAAYLQMDVDVNPLIIVQIPNKSETLLDGVERWFEAQGLTYENSQLAVWLSDRHENLEGIDAPAAPSTAVIIKQAVATGWDCPRAQILVKLRDNMDETFEIQTIGRIRRMPEAKHYGSDLLDSCYLYTFDEKFTAGVKMALDKGALNACTLFLKSEYKDITLTGEQRSMISMPRNPQKALRAIWLYAEENLGVGADKEENRTRLQAAGYILRDDVVRHTVSGETATLDFSSSDMNTISVTEKLNTHKHGRDYHQKIGKIGLEIGMEYSFMNTIIRKLFDKNFNYAHKILALEPREVYAFVLNNADRLRHLVREAMAAEMAQMQLDVQTKSLFEFHIPQSCLFTYNGEAKTQIIYKKNVYQNYLSSAAPRSTPEVKFEKFCEHSGKLKAEFDPIERAISSGGSVLIYVSKSHIYNKSIYSEFDKYIKLCNKLEKPDALQMIDELRSYIGASKNNALFYNSEMLEKLSLGIVTHHGSMPLAARLILEHFTQSGFCRICFATSTLEQGINMPFDVVYLDKFEASKSLSVKNLIGRAGRSTVDAKFDYGSVVIRNNAITSLRRVMRKAEPLSKISNLDVTDDSLDEKYKEFKEAINTGAFSDEYNLPSADVEKLHSDDVTAMIPQLLDMMFDDGDIISPNTDMKEVNDLFSKLYQQYLGRKLCQAEKSVLSTAVKIMIWKIYGKTFHRICQYRYAYASRTAERQQLYRKRNAEEANSIPAKYIVGYHDIPDKDLTAYPLVSTSIAAKDVDYDLIVYDTYDYLDKLIGFKLSDIFYAIFYQYYEATSDERALRLAKYFKYGTDKEREIWMLRYGFSFEEIEWVSECVDSIDETEIKFNDKINALDDAQLKSIEQYVHE